MTQKNIVVVGGGFGGLYTAKHLAKKLKKNKDVKITLIDKHSYFTYMTELHEVAANRVDENAIQYDLNRLFSRRKNVDVVTDEVTSINKKDKKVVTKSGSFDYDYLVLSIGAEPNDFGTPGVKEHGFTLGSWDEAVKLKRHVIDMVRRGAVERDPEIRKSYLNFVVVGSGFTGTETIGELRAWRDRLAAENKLDPEEIVFTMMEMAPTIMNMLDRKDAAKAERYFEKKNIRVMKSTGVTGVHEDYVDLNDGSTFPTRTLIWTAGVKASSQAASFGFEQGRAGRILVNKQSQVPDDKSIYVIGDVSFIDEDGTGKGQPQIVQGAESGGACAVANILADMNGQPAVDFKGKYQGFMVSLGPVYGVAYLMNTFHLSGFFATLMKHLINMLYFAQIYSGYNLFHYIMHEFFRIKGTNLFRGNISRYGNVLWTFPTRILLGMMWLVDCWGKVQGEGSWFTDKLRLPFTWLYPAQATSAASGAAETTSAASGAESAAATSSSVAPKFGLSYEYGHQPMAVFDTMPQWMESITKVMVPNKEVALAFQKGMTVVEIMLGLFLVLGFCTFFAGAMSAIFVVIFSLSGMFYWVNIWMFIAGIAVMNGSGRAFGLDRRFVPWLQRKLGKARYGVERSIYYPDSSK